MGNYCSMDGVLYCKPHFEQLFKETGTYQNKNAKPSSEKSNGTVFYFFWKIRLWILRLAFTCWLFWQGKAPSRFASFFSGTQDKCGVCKKTAYPLEKVTVEGENYHKACFRCSHGGCVLTPSTYAALEGFLYCKHHFSQLFKEKGTYAHLTETSASKKSSAAPSPEVRSEAESDSESKPKEDEPQPKAEAAEEETEA